MTFTESTVSVIIGGHSGIGFAVVEALSERPGRVVVASRRDGLDISVADNVERFFATLGYVDHVVLTAGSQAPGGKLTELDIDAAKEAFDAKFWGSLTVARVAAKYIRAGGTITFTSGFLARRTVPGTTVKTAINAALEAVAKILARELAPIRVNVVSPGLTKTEAYQAMDPTALEAMLQRAEANLPAGRYGRPEDLAKGYLFAIDNPFITGATIDIDGGALIN